MGGNGSILPQTAGFSWPHNSSPKIPVQVQAFRFVASLCFDNTWTGPLRPFLTLPLSHALLGFSAKNTTSSLWTINAALEKLDQSFITLYINNRGSKPAFLIVSHLFNFIFIKWQPASSMLDRSRLRNVYPQSPHVNRDTQPFMTECTLEMLLLKEVCMCPSSRLKEHHGRRRSDGL